MKKCIFVLLTVLFVLVSPVAPDGCGVMPVLADGSIAQGITIRQAEVFTSDATGWHKIGIVPAGTQIGIYQMDDGTGWIKNDPGQWMNRSDIHIIGVDPDPATRRVSSLLGQANSPIQIGELVYAGPDCKKVYYPGLGQCGVIPSGTPLKVANKMVAAYDGSSYLFVWINQRTNEPAWIQETDVQRKVVVATDSNVSFDWDNVVLVAMPLASHLAGNGRTIVVTVAQAEVAVRVALQGTGVLYARSDGRILIDVVRNGYRYVGFIDSKTGELASFFPPAERYQLNGQLQQAANYVKNVIEKGGYYRINPNQIPGWIRDKWLGPSPLAIVQAFVQTSEVCAVLVIMPQYQLRRFSDPRVNVTN